MWLPIVTHGEQLAERAEKTKLPPQIGVCIHRHTDTHTQQRWSVSFPKIWAQNMALLTSPYLFLGVPRPSRPLGPSCNPNPYCQRLQSPVIQKSFLQKPTDCQFPMVLQVINQPCQSLSSSNGAEITYKGTSNQLYLSSAPVGGIMGVTLQLSHSLWKARGGF